MIEAAAAAAAAAEEEIVGEAAYERTYRTVSNAEGKFSVLLDPVIVNAPLGPFTVRVWGGFLGCHLE